jgi:hypothetical protein
MLNRTPLHSPDEGLNATARELLLDVLCDELGIDAKEIMDCYLPNEGMRDIYELDQQLGRIGTPLMPRLEPDMTESKLAKVTAGVVAGGFAISMLTDTTRQLQQLPDREFLAAIEHMLQNVKVPQLRVDAGALLAAVRDAIAHLFRMRLLPYNITRTRSSPGPVNPPCTSSRSAPRSRCLPTRDWHPRAMSSSRRAASFVSASSTTPPMTPAAPSSRRWPRCCTLTAGSSRPGTAKSGSKLGRVSTHSKPPVSLTASVTDTSSSPRSPSAIPAPAGPASSRDGAILRMWKAATLLQPSPSHTSPPSSVSVPVTPATAAPTGVITARRRRPDLTRDRQSG